MIIFKENDYQLNRWNRKWGAQLEFMKTAIDIGLVKMCLRLAKTDFMLMVRKNVRKLDTNRH